MIGFDGFDKAELFACRRIVRDNEKKSSYKLPSNELSLGVEAVQKLAARNQRR